MRLVPILALLLAAAPAFAQDQGDIRETFRAATAAYDAGEYERARELYFEIWAQHPTYDTALNLAQVEFAMGNHAAAVRHATWGLDAYPPTGKRSQREYFEELLAKAKAQIATLVIEAPAEAEVWLDGTAIDEREVLVEPGKHQVRASLGEQLLTRTVMAGKGERLPVDFVFAPSDEPPPVGDAESQPVPQPTTLATQAPDTTGASPRTAAVIVGGVLTAASLGAHVALRVRAGNLEQDRDELADNSHLGPSGCVDVSYTICREIQDRDDKRVRAARWANITLGTTIAFGVATAGAYALWPKPTRAAILSPWAGPQGGGLLLEGKF